MTISRDSLIEFLKTRMGLAEEVQDDTPLFSSGLLDSFSLVDLIHFIEEALGRRMKAGDVRLEILDTIGRILSYAGSGDES
jgi:acyl carrier protein